MNRGERSWSGLVRDVGRSFLALVRAELEALAGDLQGSARTLLRALLVAAVAGAVVFWAIGLAIDVAVELLALAMPRWGAAATVLGLLLLVAAVLIVVVRRRMREIEAPAETLRRRIEESRAWWTRRIEGEEALTPPRAEAAPRVEEELP
jgi:uncharacterized membrane protein YqjE